jgi:hypothetical protein
MTDTRHLLERKHATFLTEMAIDANVSRACKAANLDRSSVYQKRLHDPEFAEKWGEALDAFTDRLESEAFRRAVVGHDKPLTHQGKLSYVYARDAKGHIIYDLADTGETNLAGEPVLARLPRFELGPDGQPRVLAVKEFSDNLLLSLLKAKKPNEYRDNTKIELGNAPGEAFRTEETPIQAARKIAFALALGLRNTASGEDLG